MRVKKLEIFGFKSFAQKTTIHFEPGVTAIVGPNGSGKSNICDSIRWVLGEHNPRDVRAPRLEDVIFNGTDNRAPLSMAEVSLTINNEQGLLPIAFTEVTITRRVFRSGESEYAINQSPCRLRDIHELFLGTGLGGGTYAIIEQGHIDMILSSKPEERRVPFEEASGVAKYLSKKQETVRRLEETEEHLIRIADIAGEVRRQVNALERAANRARQYKSQWEQLKSWEIRLAVDELSSGESRAKQVEQLVWELNSKQEAVEAEKKQLMSSLDSCNASVSGLQQELQALHASVASCASQMEQHESQFALKTRWIEEVQAQTRAVEQESAQLRQRLTQVEEEASRIGGGEAEVGSQITEAEQQRAASQQKLAEAEAALQAILQLLAAVKNSTFEAASEASHQRNQLAQTRSRLQTVFAQMSRLKEQKALRNTQLEELSQRQQATLQEQQALTAQSSQMQLLVEQAQAALNSASALRHELTGRMHQMREQLAHEKANAQVLENLWHRYEGFPDIVKVLMEQRIDGLIGPLADILQPAAGYEAVVEAALGPLAEALVVRNREALRRCREQLSAKQLESCRFLVLSDCPVASPAATATLAQAGISGPVKRYVQVESSFQPLVDWLFNDSWVIDDIDRLLTNGSITQARVVSRRGDRWDRRSWRFGGTASSAHSRLGRKTRWEHAQSYVQVLKQDAERLAAEAAEAEQQWQVKLTEFESAKSGLSHIVPALQKLDNQLAHLSHEINRLSDEQAALELEVQEIAAQQEQLARSQAMLEQVVAAAENKQKSVEESLAKAQADRENAEANRQQFVVAQAQVQAAFQSLKERFNALAARKQEVEADRGHMTQQLGTRSQQHQESEARITDLTNQLTTHQQSRQSSEEEKARFESQLSQLAEALRQKEQKRDSVLPQVLAAEHQLSSIARQIQECAQKLSERDFRKSRLLERLRELYQIDETTLQAELTAEHSALTDEQRQELSEQVQRVRGKLEGLGPVSLGSVDEYDELKRRLEFLQTQQQDLTQAREDLKNSITQINKAARTQFRETFERIKTEFQHYYTRLFDGGQADLMLMDEENILECGIDIVARPPGKRLQSISLLSGGERALTAIALLFALFKVRPSPFCILDEIDAPLDEANIDRFTRVLEEFLALSQFILITHNKKTITKADSLYGVTMAEAGISQILSAKLAKSPSGTPPAPASAAIAA